MGTALRLGLSRKSIVNYEADERIPPFDVACRWAVTTNAPIRYLAGGTLSQEEESSIRWCGIDPWSAAGKRVVEPLFPDQIVGFDLSPGQTELPFANACDNAA